MRKIITVLLLGVVGCVGAEAVSLASANAAPGDPQKANISAQALAAVGVFQVRRVSADRVPAHAVRLIPVVSKPRLVAMGNAARLHQEPAKLNTLGRAPAVAPERAIGGMKNVRGSGDFRALAIASGPKPSSRDATAREVALAGGARVADRVLISTLTPNERRERAYASDTQSARAALGPAANRVLVSNLMPSERRERGYASDAQSAKAELAPGTERVLLSELTSTEPRERRSASMAASSSLSMRATPADAKMIGANSAHRRLYAQAEYGPVVRVRPKHWK